MIHGQLLSSSSLDLLLLLLVLLRLILIILLFLWLLLLIKLLLLFGTSYDRKRSPLRYDIALLVFERGSGTSPAEWVVGLHLLQLFFLTPDSLLSLNFLAVFGIHRREVILILVHTTWTATLHQ